MLFSTKHGFRLLLSTYSLQLRNKRVPWKYYFLNQNFWTYEEIFSSNYIVNFQNINSYIHIKSTLDEGSWPSSQMECNGLIWHFEPLLNPLFLMVSAWKIRNTFSYRFQEKITKPCLQNTFRPTGQFNKTSKGFYC